MKTKLPLFLLGVALSGAAAAALTNIAQVPLLNITGTGAVKPNLMLLFDNSGSMAWAYTPDYVSNDNLCRARATLAGASPVACDEGHPPYNSADFNKQYYNPLIRYQAPIRSDGTYYNDMNAANTVTGGSPAPWSHVIDDGFDPTPSYTNLVTGFPDLKWCDSASTPTCNKNTATYTYPDNTYYAGATFYANPYYYSIAVAEYCTDESLTNCAAVSAGAAAPSGYPVAAKVRWCTSRLLTTCQAKRVGSYIYPRYSTAAGASASYGTVTINASASAAALTINGISVAGVTVTNGAVAASTGTDTALKQQALASALAASINAKTGLTNQFMACVKTPTSAPSVSPCSTYGVPVSADNVVALIAVTCVGTKSALNCVSVTDGSRAGAGIAVDAALTTVTPARAAVPPTAVITVSGSTPNSSPTPSLASVALGGTTLFSGGVAIKNKSASAVVTSLVSKINTTAASATITAYTGGNAVTPTCAALSNTRVCLVNTAAAANGAAVALGAMTNGGTIAFATSAGAGYAAATPAVTDSIPTVSVALSAGSAAPSTFVRTDIVASRASYPKGSARDDCTASAGVCTYAEEMTNFGNWYAYYRTRLQMMKSSVGLAFAPISGNYRVGLAKLSNVAAGAAIDLKPADFTGTARASWYTTLYATTTSGSTPMRPAMDNVGKMFANLAPYDYASGLEVVQYPCQQNFLIVTTDGYWNGGSTATVLNNDNAENANRFCTAARGCVDTRAQTQPSMADVALHWYNGGSNTTTVSLRPGLEPDMSKPGAVPAAAGENTHLHMNTYTLGLGVDGVMNYESNYDTAPRVGGDFYNLITGAASGCQWNAGGRYVWPDPNVTSTASTVQERVDDLWHAAVNGHGKYFSASAPGEVVAGLAAAIANMSVHVGAAAAAATSTPNISQQDNDIFTDTFTTVKWYGELSNKKIDITTGVVGTTPTWVSSDTVGRKVAAASDTRTIYMLDTAGAPALKSFTYAAMDATEKAWFDNQGSTLAQYALLSAAEKAIVNSGANVVNWLRGQQQYANDEVFRAYTLTSNTPSGAAGPIPIVLGDIASSKPAFLRDARKSYSLAGYSDYKVAQAGRAATVFTAANDGMLHAFDAADGTELWAYAPRITMKKLARQASTTYGTNHQYTTDGSPELGDVQIGGVWRTVLVAGLNGGGRGYYALDVTDPAAPRALWELCADATCAKSDADIGLTFGNVQFGMWAGRWVAYLTSGYNNVPGVDGVASGDGLGYLYIVDVADGTVLKKVSTGSGSAATPSGLAKITAISPNPFTDPVTTYVYGGDNQGKMWRFDLTDTTAAHAVVKIQMGDAGALQPITTRPDVSTCAVDQFDASGTRTGTLVQRVVLYGTGRLLDVPDTANTDVQSLYLLKDSGSLIAVRGATMVQQTLALLGASSNSNTYSVSANQVDLAVRDGWFLDWSLNAGERMNLDPSIISNGVSVVTNIPSSSSVCSVGGTSNVYQLDLCSGSYVASDTVAGSTLSNTSAAVGYIVIRLPSGVLKMITTTAAGNTITTGVAPVNSPAAHKVGWRRVTN